MNTKTKTMETTKKAVFAAVGAPVVTARKASAKWNELTDSMRTRGETFSGEARKEFDTWAAEGHKLVERIGDGPVVEQITSKIEDLDVEGQVGKLREQLDDMLASWRKGFRPESQKVTIETAPVTKKPAATKATTAKKTAAKKALAGKKAPAAKKTAAKRPAAKKPAAKKAPAAKKVASKASATK